MVDADRAKWDYHPIMSSRYVLRGKTDPGLFYQGSPTRDFRGMIELMKRYVIRRANYVDKRLLANVSLPPTPSIAEPGNLSFSAPTLSLQLVNPPPLPAKVKWRLAEITELKSPSFDPRQPRKYEIDALWEAEAGSTAEIPTKPLQGGHTYRIRARAQDSTGRWSHWSAPIQFSVAK
jgi:hypothetical protein